MKTRKKNQTKKRHHKTIVNKKLHFEVLKFIPSILVLIASAYLWIPSNTTSPGQTYVGIDRNVLAYATNTTSTGLLSSTNSQRLANGVGKLSINPKLTTAAQNKANDMVNRNYWSHQTPDGQEPWVFISNTGYKYLTAGENLAYGFPDSNTTIQGWMDSPSHKANLLNNTFTEVGFGIVNAPTYIGDGGAHSPYQVTVVVAMYAKPKNASSPPPTTTPTQTQTSTTTNTQPQTKKPTQKPTPKKEPVKTEGDKNTNNTDIDAEKAEPQEKTKEDDAANPYSSNNSSKKETSVEVKKIDSVSHGRFGLGPVAVVSTIVVLSTIWMVHRGVRLKKILKYGKKHMGKYMYMDLLLISILILAFVLMSTTGVIL